MLRRFGSTLESPASLEAAESGLVYHSDTDDDGHKLPSRLLLESPESNASGINGSSSSNSSSSSGNIINSSNALNSSGNSMNSNGTVTLTRRSLALLGAVTLGLLFLLLWRSASPSLDSGNSGNNSGNGGSAVDFAPHGAGFGFTGQGVVTGDKSVFRIGVVTDLDFDSKVDQGLGQSFWKSYYREATLTRDAQTGRYSVLFDSDKTQSVLRTRLNLDDRGMELSWLASFGGVLYAGDDRAGVVYSIENGHASARFVLADGDGRAEKGFKSEWAAVKDGSLYVGSFGKEWSNEKGEFINNNPQWVKVIDRHGGVTHVDWTRNYEALRRATGHSFPGYLFHEAAAWNPALQRWVFVPRRASKERYDAELDEVRGANLLIVADASFTDIQVHKISTDMPVDGVQPKGFSDIKFVPGHPRDIVALRSMEHKGQTKSWITVFNLDGVVLMDDVFIDAYKFEGIEFLGTNGHIH
jgi:soluble calcium-activated nucleotidase 1